MRRNPHEFKWSSCGGSGRDDGCRISVHCTKWEGSEDGTSEESEIESSESEIEDAGARDDASDWEA